MKINWCCNSGDTKILENGLTECKIKLVGDDESIQYFFYQLKSGWPLNKVVEDGQACDCTKKEHCGEADDISCNYRCGNYTPAT
jgi:hypothetical protein